MDTLDRWIGSKPRKTKEVSYGGLKIEFGEDYISYSVTQENHPWKCELCGAETDVLHQLGTGRYGEYFPDERVCWGCYIKEHKKLYEEYGRCPKCYSEIYLDEWPNFKFENGHIINVNFIELNPEKMLDDAYEKLPPNDYKKLHDAISR